MGKLFDKFVNRFSASVYEGGCETCGYGAAEGMDEETFQDLLAEIDKWVAETFTEKK